MLFAYHVHMSGGQRQGFAEEGNKKLAQQRACQTFLKSFFPAGTTWAGMLQIITSKDKDLLAGVVSKVLERKEEEMKE